MIKLKAYTDGACSSNGTDNAVGGWAVIVTNGDKIKKRFIGGELNTTNNRMELQAVIQAVNYFINMKKRNVDKNYSFTILSDSLYVVNAVNKRWVKKWINNGWLTSKGTAVLNQDLWLILNELDAHVDFEIIHVKGHNGNKYNEECDKMAKSAVKRQQSKNIESR